MPLHSLEFDYKQELTTILCVHEFSENISTLEKSKIVKNYLFQSGFSGVCGALTYRMDMNSEEVEDAHYLNVMWTVPYDLNLKWAFY